MGLCNAKMSPEEAEAKRKEKHASRQVDIKMTEENEMDADINKLLLLGAGGSGKSTLFKQMITIYGKGFPEVERKSYVPIIHNNTVQSMKTLLVQSKKMGHKLQEENQKYRGLFEGDEIKDEAVVDEKIGKMMISLWKDKAIQETYSHCSKFQITDSAKYYFDRMQQIMDPEYTPSEQDVLRSRVPTTGIVENEFIIDGNTFKMFDVGGQRSERKKWIHCFEDVTAVLFVAAISAYDQVLYEDESTNRMTEALDLFEEITNSEWFESTSMILFLNKRDIFAEKIERIPLGDYFPNFAGENNYKDATEFIHRLFDSKNHQDKNIYTHITCATNTDNVYAVFNSVKDIIIRAGLARAGLM